jgi:DNA-binding response OmpR family regulator
MKAVGVATKGAGVILVADDDAAVRGLVVAGFSEHGHTVIEASDGEAALRLAVERHPDVILLDVMMPRMDGRDVLRRLKADPQLASIPVFVYSARGAHSDRLLGLELGAEDYIEKPFELDMLVRRLEYALWKSRGA